MLRSATLLLAVLVASVVNVRDVSAASVTRMTSSDSASTARDEPRDPSPSSSAADAMPTGFDKICCEFENFGETHRECKLPAGCKLHGGHEVDEQHCGGSCSGHHDESRDEPRDEPRDNQRNKPRDERRDEPRNPSVSSKAARAMPMGFDKICCEFENFGETHRECKLPAGCKLHGGHEVDEQHCGGSCSGHHDESRDEPRDEPRDNQRNKPRDERRDEPRNPSVSSKAARAMPMGFDKICCEFENFGETHRECKLPAGCKLHGGHEVDEQHCGGSCSGSESK